MGAICGIVGKRDTDTVRAIFSAMKASNGAPTLDEGPLHCIASDAPATQGCAVDGTLRLGQDPLLPEQLCAKLKAGACDKLSLQGVFVAAAAVDGGCWLLRDRIGVKAIYYYANDESILFATELHALMTGSGLDRRLNLASVDQYLTLRCVPGPDTIFQGIRKVRPGFGVRWSRGDVREEPFAPLEKPPRFRGKEQAAKHLFGLLEASTKRAAATHLLWSGGVDCASLAAAAPGLSPVFTSLEHGWQDEQRLAKESAKRMKLSLEVLDGRRLTEDRFYQAVDCLDEPVGDAALLPTWEILECVSRVAHTVVSGHGADEVLGGYPRYRLMERAHEARTLIPANQVAGILPSLPPNAFVRRGSRYLAAINDPEQAYLSLLSVFDKGEREDLYTDAMKAALAEHTAASIIQDQFKEKDLTANILNLDRNVIIPEVMLAATQGAAAVHGLRLEYPFLEDELVHFVGSLPPDLRFGVRSKPLLRIAMRGRMPASIRMRARRGFRVPQEGHVVKVIESIAKSLITPERVEGTGLFKWRYVNQVVASASHNVYRRRQFWALLLFFGWYRQVMER